MCDLSPKLQTARDAVLPADGGVPVGMLCLNIPTAQVLFWRRRAHNLGATRWVTDNFYVSNTHEASERGSCFKELTGKTSQEDPGIRNSQNLCGHREEAPCTGKASENLSS